MAPSECLSQQRPSTSRQPRLGPPPLSTYLRVRCFAAHWLRKRRGEVGLVEEVAGVGRGVLARHYLSQRRLVEANSRGRGKVLAHSNSNRLTLDCCFVIGANCKENSADERRKCFPAPTRVPLLVIGLFIKSKIYKK